MAGTQTCFAHTALQTSTIKDARAGRGKGMQRHHNRLYPETDNTARPNAKEGQTTNIVKRSSVVALPLWCTVLLRPHKEEKVSQGESEAGSVPTLKCQSMMEGP